jgi:hypothetical protein
MVIGNNYRASLRDILCANPSALGNQINDWDQYRRANFIGGICAKWIAGWRRI